MNSSSKICSKWWNLGLNPESTIRNQGSQPLHGIVSIRLPVVLKVSDFIPHPSTADPQLSCLWGDCPEKAFSLS